MPLKKYGIEHVALPTPVEIVGTTFGNELQNKILTAMRLSNLLLFYFCAITTIRWIVSGN